MKICIINNLYYPYSRGGADKIAKIIGDGLEKENNQIFVISTKPPFAKKNDEVKNNYYLHSTFHYLNKIPKIFRLFWHLGDLFNIFHFSSVNKILKKEKPDLVITHNLKGIGLLSCLAIRKNKIKQVHYLHDIQLIHPSGLMIYEEEKNIDNFLTRIYTTVCAKLIGSPQLVVSPSNWLLDLHIKKKFFNKSKKIVQINPIDNNWKKESEFSEKATNKKFNFLYVGEIEKQKGVFLAVEAFLLLDKYIKEKSELIIVGTGGEIKKLKRFVRGEDNIKIMGWKNNIKKYMNNADVLLVPSYCYDNSPTVIYEATTVGLPTLGANLGGIKELVDKFGGTLFPPKNKKILAQKMASLVKGQESNSLIPGYQEELQKITIQNYIRKIISII